MTTALVDSCDCRLVVWWDRDGEVFASVDAESFELFCVTSSF